MIGSHLYNSLKNGPNGGSLSGRGSCSAEWHVVSKFR